MWLSKRPFRSISNGCFTLAARKAQTTSANTARGSRWRQPACFAIIPLTSSQPLAADVFVSDFAEAIAIFLHEHAHIFGHDGHRGFTDALTELIETIVRHRKIMDEYEEKWETVKKSVMKEREGNASLSAADESDWLASKTEEELRVLVRQLPPAVLRAPRRHDGELPRGP